MANIIGTKGNDTLVGSSNADTIKGLAGNDTITGKEGNDTLTGGGGKDKFVYNFDDYKYFSDATYLGDGTDIITDFGGVGQETNLTAAVIAQVDTIKFLGANFTARYLLLTQNGNNLEVTFEGVPDAKVILQNFKLENLENLKASKGRPAIGNILFDGQTSIIDSFHVLDANSTETTLRIKNTVTFFNNLDNNITGLDNSNDVVNGQGGNDKINGLSGNDLLRGGAGNDILLGGVGNDILLGGAGKNILKGDVGNDFLDVGYSTGNNLLDGGVGNDNLSATVSTGDNLLNGGDGNDDLSASGTDGRYNTPTSGNNTLNGGAGKDTLNVGYSSGNNLLNGGDGNDDLSASGTDGRYNTPTSGNNTLNGGAGDDRLSAFLSTGNNLLSGGEGKDTIYGSVSGNDTIDGGKGDDLLFYYGARGAITSTFNATSNIGSITVGTNRVSYKNIERLYISGTEYDDLIVGSNGNDMIGGSLGNDMIDGGKGDDLLSINYGYYDYGNYYTKGITTTINATTNTGSITDGTDRVIYKNIERLDIRGTHFDDLIVGSNGDDTLDGNDGNDILIGGKGYDSLIGGSGTDTFAFNSFNQGIDRLDDFKATNELIQVTADGFGGGLSIGSLKTSQFTLGASATTSQERFIYNNITGALFFDQDGSANAFTQVQFAQLSAGLSLTKNNFVVV